jgi:hypothetical protein
MSSKAELAQRVLATLAEGGLSQNLVFFRRSAPQDLLP